MIRRKADPKWQLGLLPTSCRRRGRVRQGVRATTKGKVIGAVWRARRAGDLRFQPRPPKPKAAPKARTVKPPDEHVGNRKPPRPEPEPPGPVPFLQLKSGMCRFPLNSPERGSLSGRHGLLR